MKKKFISTTLCLALTTQAFCGYFPVVVQAISLEGVTTTNALIPNNTIAPEAWGPVPDANQLKYQKDELAAFCHFGMNTYTGKEWGDGEESPSQFSLDKPFDADAMVASMKEAGFKKVIVTAKHHDGFCIWRSAYTNHDLESTTYKGDILEEISAACTKYNIDMGLYLSPWDVNNESYGYRDENGNPTTPENDVLDYNEYYDNQLIEILSNDKYGNNGHFVEVWMDGAKGSGSFAQDYDFDRWFTTIQNYEGKAAGFEADCSLFGSGAYTTVRWIGNELGFANEETWAQAKADKNNNTFDANSQSIDGHSYTVGFPDGNQWSVPEADARITSGWFWGNNKKTPKSIEQLAEMYFRSVGHNATLLLNIPPNTDGKVDPLILDRMKEFGDNIAKTFSKNLASAPGVTIQASSVRGNDIAYSPLNVVDDNDTTYWTMDDGATTGSILIDLGSSQTFDVVSIEEAIQLGQRISAFEILYKNGDSEWKVFQAGTTIGAKRLCRRTPVKADQLKINITSSYDVPLINEIGVFKASEGFELGSAIPADITIVDNLDKDLSDGFGFSYNSSDWAQEKNPQFPNGTGMWANAGKEATLTFNGTKAWLIGTKDPSHGTADLFIDEDSNKVASINTHQDTRSVGQIIYETEELQPGQHTLRILNTGTIGIQGAYVLDNDGKGMFEIEHPKYTVYEDMTFPVKVKRIGGSVGSCSVILQDNPGSAVQSSYVPTEGIVLTFDDGEIEKEAFITTKRYTEETGDLSFYLELVDPTNGAIIGFTPSSTVTIKDTEQIDTSELIELVNQAKKLNQEHYQIESYQAMQAQLILATELIASTNPYPQDIINTYKALEDSLKALQKRTAYTINDPFTLPLTSATSKTLEAEFFELIQNKPGEIPNNINKNVRYALDQASSNGSKVSWFETGNQIKVPFNAPRAGSYIFTMTYQSGRTDPNLNTMNWSGINIEEGSYNVPANGSSTEYLTNSFEVIIPQAGPGELVFTADTSSSPNIDKFEVSPKSIISSSIISITKTSPIIAPLNTSLVDLPLLTNIEVELDNGNKELVDVEWSCESFTPDQPGEYQFIGSLILDTHTENPELLTATQLVTITDTPERLDPTVMLTGPSTVTGGKDVEISLSIVDVANSVYAQDITVTYDTELFTVKELKGIDPTMMIDKVEANGEIRFLLATDKGLIENNESVKIILKANNVTDEKTGQINIIQAKLGVVETGISSTLEAKGSSHTMTVLQGESELDKTALLQTIQIAQKLSNEAPVGNEVGQYPLEAKTALDSAIQVAEQVAINSNDQTEINQANQALKIAIDTFKSSVITSKKEDINQDGQVDVADLALVAYYYRATSTSDNWHEAKKADITNDGKIDITDLALVANKILGK